MLFRSEAAVTQLASVKAVTPDYPLRGSVKLKEGNADRPTRDTPAPGTVWVDENLLLAHKLQVGSQLRLGERSFRIAQVISVEPDRGAAFMNFAPRVMLAQSDLASTGLIQYGSRVTYRLLLAGEPVEVKAFQRWVEQGISSAGMKGVNIESLESGRPEMRATLDRAEQFLALVGLLSAMLAAVAIAMAARRFMLRHLDACAMLRCLGLTQGQVTRMYLIEFLLVGLAGSALGVLVGFGAHFVLLAWLGSLVAEIGRASCRERV